MKLISNLIKVLPLIINLFVSYCRSDENCESIGVDAITGLYNGTIVIFHKSNIYFWNKEAHTMTGPCSEKNIFDSDQFKGPVEAAVTIIDHPSIIEFIGATLLMVKTHFYTYKNLKPYVVEWGSLQYIPVQGELKTVATSSESVQKILEKSRIAAAYYDPTDSTTKFVFADQSVMAFNFAYGIEFETPTLTSLGSELKSFGVDMPSSPVTALLTLRTNNGYQMYIFSNEMYCTFEMRKGTVKQNCDLKPVKELFECKDIKTRSCGTGAQRAMTSDQTPIAAAVNAKNPISNRNANQNSNQNPNQNLNQNLNPILRGAPQPMANLKQPKGNKTISSRSGLEDDSHKSDNSVKPPEQSPAVKVSKSSAFNQREPLMFVLVLSLLSVIIWF